MAKKVGKDVPKFTAREKKEPVFSTYFPGLSASTAVRRAVLAAADKAVFGGKKVSHMLPGDVLRMKSYFIAPIGQLVVFELGNLEKGILPSVDDLMRLRDSLVKPLVKLSRTAAADEPCCHTEWVFFPPVIQVRVSGTMEKPKVVLTLGDKERNIIPNAKDLLNLKAVFDPAFKRMRPKGMAPVQAVYKGV